MVRNRQSSSSTWTPVEPVEGSQSRPDIKEVWRRLQMIAGLCDLRRLAPWDDDPQVMFVFFEELESTNFGGSVHLELDKAMTKWTK